MLKIAICDTGRAESARLAGLLREWARTLCAQITVAEFENAAAFFEDYAPGKYAFVFLDAGMEGGAAEGPKGGDAPAGPQGVSGLEMARHIRAASDHCQIVFLADSAQPALACYGTHPAGFFLRPLECAPILELLKWHRAAFLPAMGAITVTSGRASRKILLMDILYISVSGRTSLLHLKNETVATNRTLSAFTSQTQQAGFLRCHRGCLVNRAHAVCLEPQGLVLDDGSVVPVSKERASAVREWLGA